METTKRTDTSLVNLVARLAAEGADGRAGLRALLREVETKYPGEVERMASALTLQKLQHLRGYGMDGQEKSGSIHARRVA